jgi:hypothetical protein
MAENFSIFDAGWDVHETFLTNTSISDANVGKELWDIDAISGGADTLTYETADGETFLRMTGGGSGDGDGTALSLGANSVSFGGAGGYCNFRVRVPDITSNAIAANNFRIGFTDVRDSGEPVVGIWVDNDGGVVSIDCASANGDVNAAVSASKLTSSTTLVLGTTYNMRLAWSGENANGGPDTVTLHINGQLAAELKGVCLIGQTETCEPTITHWCDTGGGSTLELDVCGYEAESFIVK